MIFLGKDEQNALATCLAQKSKNSAHDWLAFIKINLSLMEKLQRQHLQLVEKHIASIEQMRLLLQLLDCPHPENPLQKTYFDIFIARVDESAHSFTQWVEALEDFSLWLQARQQRTETVKMLNYLECCAKSIDGTAYPLELKNIALEMLNQHGFLG